MAEQVGSVIQNPLIEITPINPEYGSWTLRVVKGDLDMEYVWGPLSGFGGTDLTRPATPNDTQFDYADEGFNSIDEALEFLRKLYLKHA